MTCSYTVVSNLASTPRCSDDWGHGTKATGLCLPSLPIGQLSTNVRLGCCENLNKCRINYLSVSSQQELYPATRLCNGTGVVVYQHRLMSGRHNTTRLRMYCFSLATVCECRVPTCFEDFSNPARKVKPCRSLPLCPRPPFSFPSNVFSLEGNTTGFMQMLSSILLAGCLPSTSCVPLISPQTWHTTRRPT